MRARRPVTLALAVLLFTPAHLAHADPGDGPDGAPSQAEVDAAAEAAQEGAAEVEEIQERLEAAREKVDEAHRDAEIAAEEANAARETLRLRTEEAAAATAAAEDAAAQAAASKEDVDHLAAQVYMRGGSLDAFSWLFAFRTRDVARTEADLDAATSHRDVALGEARQAQTEAEAARETATTAQAAQQEAATTAAEALEQAQAAVVRAEDLTEELEAEEARLVERLADLRRTSVEVELRRQEALLREAEEARQAEIRAQIEAAAARSEAAASDAGDASAAPVAPGDLPAPDSQQAARVIAWAQGQLGKPYLWGGNGPDAFDCSGLTVGAWSAAGRSIPRTAQWQYDATDRVAIADLRPGDLVFYGSSDRSIHHVGIYVGSGRMIEAPRTGLDVRYASIYRSQLLPYGGRV